MNLSTSNVFKELGSNEGKQVIHSGNERAHEKSCDDDKSVRTRSKSSDKSDESNESNESDPSCTIM